MSAHLETLRAPQPCPPPLLGEGPPRASPSAGCGPGACHLPPGSMSGFPNCLVSLSLLLEDKNILHYFLLTSSKAFTLKLSVTHLKFVLVYDMRQRPLSYFPLWIATKSYHSFPTIEMPLWLCNKFSCINRCFSTYLPLRDYHPILLAIALQFILSSNRAVPSHCPCSSIFYFFFSFPPSDALQYQFAKFHLNIQWIFFFRIILDLGS